MNQGHMAVLSIVIAMVVLTIAGCSDDDATSTPGATEAVTGTPMQASPTQTETAAPMSPTPVPASPTATPPADTGMHPPHTRTGDPFVDSFLEARQVGDLDAIADLLVFAERPCSARPGIGQVDCREGEEDGTLVPVMSVNGGCEPIFLREDSRLEIAEDLADRSRGLYAVLYRLTGAPDEYAVFLAREATAIFGVKIVRLSGATGAVLLAGATCGQSVAEVYSESEADEIILAPR